MDVFLNHWNKRMRKNHMDTLSKAKNSGKKPNWMGDGVWTDFLRLRDTPTAKVSNICLLFYKPNINLARYIRDNLS